MARGLDSGTAARQDPFLARDTHFIRDQVAAFLGVLPDEIDSEYAYVSRGSLLVPSLADFPIARLNHLFSGRSPSTVAGHLRRLGLAPERYANVARSAGFDGLDAPVRNGDPRMIALLGKLHRELLLLSAERRPLARRYVEQLIGDAKRVMLVDIGWVGNTQASLVRLLGPRHADVTFTGQYVGVFAGARENAYPGHPMLGWLTRGDDDPRIERLFWWSGAIEVLEFAMTAPHGTTLGYREEPGGRVVPVLESDRVEGTIGELASRLQKGAADFIDAFIATFSSVPPEALSSRAWAADFFRLITDPRPDEAALLGDLTHGDVAGDSSIRLPLAPLKTERDEAVSATRTCFWKVGYAVRNGLTEDEAFSPAVYLALHPDIEQALDEGSLESAVQHWTQYGRREGRTASWAGWMRQLRALTAQR